MASDKVIIEVRQNEWARREWSPHTPYSPEDIAADALDCANAGAAIVHYHARDAVTGAASVDLAVYAETVRRIRAKRPDLIVMPTLGMDASASPRDRIAHIAAMAQDPATKPDLAPIDMACTSLDYYDGKTRQFRWTDRVYVNRTGDWILYAETMRSVGVRPAAILWHIGSIRATRALVEMGVLDTPLWCELVLTEGGILDAHPGTMRGLEAYLDFLPADDGWPWAVLCFGGNLLSLATAVMERGGHIAIGVGDYSYPHLGCPTNAELVERIAKLANLVGRGVATPDEARATLRL